MLALTSFDTGFPVTTSEPNAYGSRFRRSAEALLLSYRSITVLGAAHDIEEMVQDRTSPTEDWCSFDLMVDRRRIALVCVSMKMWRSTLSMRPMQAVKSHAEHLGRTVVMVPEPFFRSPCRPTKNDEVDTTGLRSILEVLLANGSASLIEVAARLRHPDPVNAVLQMVASGLLDIDLNAPILPGSGVRFASGCGR